jgi:hypothetical protein
LIKAAAGKNPTTKFPAVFKSKSGKTEDGGLLTSLIE